MKGWQIVVALLGLNFLLWLALGEGTNLLAQWSLSFHVEVLFVLFPALFLPVGQSLAYLLCLTLMLGPHRPVSAGWILLTLCVLWQVGIWMRSRIQHHKPMHMGGFAGLLQAVTVLLWSLPFIASQPNVGGFWIRVGCEAAISALVVGLLAQGWCNLQYRLLEGFGWRVPNIQN